MMTTIMMNTDIHGQSIISFILLLSNHSNNLRPDVFKLFDQEVTVLVEQCDELLSLTLRVLEVVYEQYYIKPSNLIIVKNICCIIVILQVLSSIILCFVSPSYSWFISIVLAVGYQWTLSCEPLNLINYILLGSDGTMSRNTGLVDANREGLLSCVGYLAIYFAGVQIGIYLLQRR